jgi:nitrogen PTS system EIIA component
MIRISSKLMVGAVATDIQCSSKSAILAKLADLAAKNYGLDAATVLDGLEERERLGSTGFGGGTAIPHCKMPDIESPMGVFLRLAKSVDYDAVDDEPVDLVFGLISPSHDGAMHLRCLAEISRMLRDEKSTAQIRGAADSDALFALLTLTEERDAA